MSARDEAQQDAELYGVGFMVDGAGVHPSRAIVVRGAPVAAPVAGQERIGTVTATTDGVEVFWYAPPPIGTDLFAAPAPVASVQPSDEDAKDAQRDLTHLAAYLGRVQAPATMINRLMSVMNFIGSTRARTVQPDSGRDAVLVDSPAVHLVDAMDVLTDVDEVRQHIRTYIAAHPANGAQVGELSNSGITASVLEFAAQVVELYDDATLSHADYMIDAGEAAGIIRTLPDYLAAAKKGGAA